MMKRTSRFFISVVAGLKMVAVILHIPSRCDLVWVNYVRQCRAVVEVMGETIAALKLANVENWKQLFFDGTTRWQKSFTALIIGLLSEGEDEDQLIDPVVVSS